MPKRFTYGFFLLLARLLFHLLYKIRYDTDKRLSALGGPFFIVGNHVSFVDPIICAMAMRKHPIRFVSGQEVANTKILRPLLKQFAIIEIKPFRVNFSTTKEIITSIDGGVSVALYPETQRSIAGGLTPFGPATAKLIKHLKVPVVSVICHGGYLGWPRWAPTLRTGKMEVKTELLFTEEEIRSLSLDAIQQRLVQAMDTDDYSWQTTRPRPARFLSRKPAEKLSAVCHWCPECDRPLVIRSERNKLFCPDCTFSLRVDSSGFFSASPDSSAPFDHPLDYALWQREKTKTALLEGTRFVSTCRLEFLENVGDKNDPQKLEHHGILRFGRYFDPFTQMQIFNPYNGLFVSQQGDAVALAPGDFTVNEELFYFLRTGHTQRRKTVSLPAVAQYQRPAYFILIEKDPPMNAVID